MYPKTAKRAGVANAPWVEFRVGTPDENGNGCLPLTELYHVAHLEAAHRILVDGRIRSGLIFDKSKLNTERILVTWLSPNFWHPGFRYGSVQFVFDWSSLVEGHKAYWVESMAYGVEACRILLTRNDHSSHPNLIPYDPSVGDGPWWFDEASGSHYWNGNYCLEFMIEHDLELSGLQDLGFVLHHSHRCSIDPSTCPERGMDSLTAASRFLARLAASKLTLPASVRQKEDSRCRRSAGVASFIAREIAELTGRFEGGLTSTDPGSFAVTRAILDAYANPLLYDDIPHLARLFRSPEDLGACCTALIQSVVMS